MACRMLESWDHYAISDLTRKWTQIYGGVNTTAHAIVAGAGRRGTSAFRVRKSTTLASSIVPLLERVLTSTTTTFYTGFAFRAADVGSGSGWSSLRTVGGGGNSLNTVTANSGALDVPVNTLAACRYSYYTHVGLSINNNGTISICRGNADSLGGAGLQGQDRLTLLGTTSPALQIGQTNYVEFKVVVHPSNGSILLKVNGDTWFSTSGIRTQADGASSTTAWQGMGLAGMNATLSDVLDWFFDDLYCGDSDATDPYNQMIDLVGDLRVDYANVFQDGASRDWPPLSGTDHFAMVDDNPPDLDTTYNATTTLNAADTFLKNGVPVIGASVIALQPIYLRRRTDGGNTSTAAVIRDAGTNYTGSKAGTATAEGDPSTYVYNWWTVTQRPSAAGTALTQALVDAMEIGYKKVS